MESPIIESLRDDLAALHEAGAIAQAVQRKFDALLTPSGPVDCRITDTTIPADQGTAAGAAAQDRKRQVDFACPARLKAALDRYAVLHAQTYGEAVDATTLART